MDQEYEGDMADMETDRVALAALEFDAEAFDEMVYDDLSGRS